MAQMIIADEQVCNEVNTTLKRHPLMDTSHINITVTDGIVYLTGNVTSYIQKTLAEELAGRVTGVRNLVMELDVVLNIIPPADAETENFLRTTLQWKSSLADTEINIKVLGGEVSLSGTVKNYYQKRMLMHMAEDIKGVKSIRDDVKIVPACAFPDHLQVWHALMSCASIETQRLRIHVEKGQVQLWGIALSMEEKRDAERAVWSVPGVYAVENRIVVNYMNDFAY